MDYKLLAIVTGILIITYSIILVIIDRPIINIAIQKLNGEPVEYIAIYSNRKVKKIDNFETDKSVKYKVDNSCLLNEKNNKKDVTKIRDIVIRDEDGNDVDEEIMKRLYPVEDAINNLNIVFSDVTILENEKTRDKFFVYLKCEKDGEMHLYEMTRNKLKDLQTFPLSEIIGVHIE